MKNGLKSRLLSGGQAFGVWMMTNSLDCAEILSHTNVDLVMIDTEHGSSGLETAGHMVSLIRSGGRSAMIRVSWNDLSAIKRALDTGADGIMIPMVNTKEEAVRAVSLCKYPPKGVRGTGASRATIFGGDIAGYVESANDEILTIVQIEHIDAIKNLEDILSVPGIDVAFVGTFDLGMSMGILGKPMHPDIVEACEKVIKACQKYNVVPAVYTDAAHMERHMAMGFRVLIGGADGMFVYNGANELAEKFEALKASESDKLVK